MSLLLAIHTWHGGAGALARHWPYFKAAGADEIAVVTTRGTHCEVPEGAKTVDIGINCYIHGDLLNRRLIDTIDWMLESPHDEFVIAEYDVLFQHPIRRPIVGFCGYLAGGKPNGLDCNFFVHNPWMMDRETAVKISKGGHEMIDAYITVGGSPDCFLGHLIEKYNIPFNSEFMSQFSRNSLDLPGDTELAAKAWKDGVSIIHGCKTQKEYDLITQ